jgi:hypothetical protein
VRAFYGVLLGSILLISAYLVVNDTYPSFLEALRFTTFHVSASPPPPAMPVTDYAQWPLFAPLAALRRPRALQPRRLGAVPPPQAVAILRKAGLKGALVSSSDDEGTQKLLAAGARPHRARAAALPHAAPTSAPGCATTASSRYIEERLAKYRYVGIGEFHLFGADAELPVPRRMVALARERGLLLHAHSDADAVNRLFAQWPEARMLWAHSGFDAPEAVREMLRRHRACGATWPSAATMRGGQGRPRLARGLREFPERFMVGTDTFTPERWHYIGPHADWTRAVAGRPAAGAGRTHRLAQRRHPAARRRARHDGRRPAPARRANRGGAGRACGPFGARPPAGPPGARARHRLEAASARHRVVFVPQPAPLASGRHFTLDITVCPRAGASLPLACASTPTCRPTAMA